MIKRTPTKWFAYQSPWWYGLSWKRLRQDFAEGTYDPGNRHVAWEGELVKVIPQQSSSFQYLGLRARDRIAIQRVLPLEVHEQWQNFLVSDDWRRLLRNRHPDFQTCKYQSHTIPVRFRLNEKIVGLGQSRATASQWLGILDGQQGVAAWERLWSGLWDWLGAQPDDKLIDKTELIARAHFRCVRPRFLINWTTHAITSLQFDRLSRTPTLKQRMQIKCDNPWSTVVLKNRSIGYQIAEVARPDLFEGTINYWQVFNRRGQMMRDKKKDHFPTATAAVEFCWRDAARQHRLRGSRQAATQWADYALSTNEYQETLLTLPDFPADVEAGHFECRNVLLFVRTTVAYTRRADRVLLLEEVQSDWLQHPDQRTVQWSTSEGQVEVQVPWQKTWLKIACQLVAYLAAQQRCRYIAWSNSNILADRYGEDATTARLKRLYDRTLPKTFKRLLAREGNNIRTRKLFLDNGQYRSTITADGITLVNDYNDSLLPSANSRRALRAAAIANGLMPSVELSSAELPDAIASELIEQGLIL